MNKRPFIIVFTALGLVLGLVSAYLSSVTTMLALVLGVYFLIAVPIYMNKKAEKEVRTLMLETALNYLATWLVIFFLLSNIL